MSIEFCCPNGHRLSCSDSLAGKPGRCPKCQSSFRVPAASGESAESSDSRDFYPELPNKSGIQHPSRSSKSLVGGNGAVPAEEIIVFLCPNGHKLNGPLRLQGKPGQCPHCSARFVIPSYEDEELPEPMSSEGVSHFDRVEEFDPVTEEEAKQLPQGELPFLEPAPEEIPPAAEAEHGAMSEFFLRLWDEKPKGSVVEIFLNDSAVVTPERFARYSAQQPVGVFAIKTEGKLTVIGIAWSAVTRVILRGLNDLPRGMFD